MLAQAADPSDRRAWRRFESTYGPLIVAFCRALGLQLADAEDVRQEVMINLSSALPGFRYDRQRGRFRQYLGRAVRNAVARHLGRHASRAALLQNDVLESLVCDDGTALESHWDAQWVRHHCRLALTSLRRAGDPQHVDVFDQLLAGRSIGEVAAAFEITPEHVRKIKQRLRDRLREIVARQIHEEDASDG